MSKDKEKKKSTFWSDFKAFAFKGNVIDMAVGVIIATTFSKIVTSLVNDVLMPFLSWLIGSSDFSVMNITLVEPTLDAEGAIVDPGTVILIGNFITNIVNFIFIAFIVFLVVRFMGRLIKKRETAPPPPPAPTKEELLLTEIRDLLKEKK